MRRNTNYYHYYYYFYIIIIIIVLIIVTVMSRSTRGRVRVGLLDRLLQKWALLTPKQKVRYPMMLAQVGLVGGLGYRIILRPRKSTSAFYADSVEKSAQATDDWHCFNAYKQYRNLCSHVLDDEEEPPCSSLVGRIRKCREELATFIFPAVTPAMRPFPSDVVNVPAWLKPRPWVLHDLPTQDPKTVTVDNATPELHSESLTRLANILAQSGR
eukprot:GHVT01009528.1.p1 GENE.GHVT01009528.1~~GHVT01009528.1.p1  ORF type:complete len:213 (+),score=18.63 GHVT01009528.1:266-904(+)